MSVFQQIRDQLNRIFTTTSSTNNHERKRRANSSEDFDFLPTKSRKVEEIYRDFSEYSDHEMDTFDLEKRKKEIRKSQNSRRSNANPTSSFFNGQPQLGAGPLTGLYLSNAPINVTEPLFLINANQSNFGQPLANSSRYSSTASRYPPALVPLAPRRVPDAVPISKTHYGLFNGGSSSFNHTRGFKMVEMAKLHNQNKSQADATSILNKTHKDNSRKCYLELLQKIVPNIYQPSPFTTSISLKDATKTVDAQTDTVDLTSNHEDQNENTVDLTDEKASASEESLNRLMLKLQCKPSFMVKADTLKERYEAARRESDRKIVEQEQIVLQREKETEECHKKFRQRILDAPISFEDILLQIEEPEDEEEEVSYPVLTNSHREVIKKALIGGPAHEVIINKFSLSITRADICTLSGMTWLNDEVINFYMNLIVQRSQDYPDLPKTYCFNTFFIPTLISRGHGGVRRWTRKVDIFSYDLIPVPVHVGKVHWCMAVIRMKEKIIRYYDSMGNPNQQVLDALEQYLIDEAKDKKQITLDTTDWIKQSITDCPHQTNGSDCGVFSCMFAEHLTRNSSFTFSQSEMPYFRQKMIFEISTGELLT